MYIAISTDSLSQSTPEALSRAADLGFKHVEVNLTSNEFGYGYKRKPAVRFYRQLKEQIDSLGLAVWSVRAPELTQEQMFSLRSRSEILIHGSGAAGILGGRVYVVEPADIFLDQQVFTSYVNDHTAPPIIDGFDKLWAQVANRHMTLALINRDYWSGTPLTNHAERLGMIIDSLAIGCALDLFAGTQRSPLATWLEYVENRLAVAYLYNSDPNDQPAFPPVSDQVMLDTVVPLQETRLKCITMRTNPRQSDDEIIAGREWLRQAVGGTT